MYYLAAWLSSQSEVIGSIHPCPPLFFLKINLYSIKSKALLKVGMSQNNNICSLSFYNREIHTFAQYWDLKHKKFELRKRYCRVICFRINHISSVSTAHRYIVACFSVSMYGTTTTIQHDKYMTYSKSLLKTKDTRTTCN